MRLVLPRCRHSLTREDETFLAETLATTPAAIEAVIALLRDPPMRDALLDEAVVFQTVLDSPRSLNISPGLYFYLLVRHSLKQSGVDDRELADYLATLLLDYLPDRSENRMHVPYLGDCMSEIAASAGTDRFFLVVELADRLLFLTGLFPAHFEHRRQRRGAPSLGFYENVGLAHYRSASAHTLAREFCLEPIFKALGEAFHEVRLGLNRIGDNLAFAGDDGPAPARYLLN
ncbi:hypothetical protein H5P28_18670 [Ruficoccus amylovorans]|uniref:Uncharacterized protein n=1 Tax=Ruficoccus amylovorans TaxID=1804625 RepID=A0A842HHR7_9BACT|nr:hypothetical protein [Ruficoccus amylovorans]MBC2596295.1 hypothetical protein [Ruficoccus amylovorans]